MTPGTWKTLSIPFDQALEDLPAALAANGFGIVSRIDLQNTFAQKIATHIPRYMILGACNPALAYQAVSHDPQMGLALPCNIVLREDDAGVAHIGAVDPIALLGGQRPEFAGLAQKAAAALKAAMDSLP